MVEFGFSLYLANSVALSLGPNASHQRSTEDREAGFG